MKKMILLAGLLVLGTMGYAAGNEAETTFTASVTVVSKLTVDKTKDMNFGIMPQGTTKNKADTPAEIVISGASGANVSVEFQSQTRGTWNGDLVFSDTNVHGKVSEIRGLSVGDNKFKGNVSLTGGSTKLIIDGNLTVEEKAEVKSHTSEAIIVKVKYENL